MSHHLAHLPDSWIGNAISERTNTARNVTAHVTHENSDTQMEQARFIDFDRDGDGQVDETEFVLHMLTQMELVSSNEIAAIVAQLRRGTRMTSTIDLNEIGGMRVRLCLLTRYI